jgi:hypothetical protein
VEQPTDVTLPFLSYGIFRPRQLAFFQLAELVADLRDPIAVSGRLLVRDGLPIVELDPSRSSSVDGALLHFQPELLEAAYKRISGMEPDAQYRWDTVQLDEVGMANILVARRASHGSHEWDFDSHDEWDGWRDPLFTDALEVVEETLSSSDFHPDDLRPTFRLQMAYLLLWSSIERYLSLRYHLGPKNENSRVSTSGLINKLAEEPAFVKGLSLTVTEPRRIYRADDPGKHVDLDVESPKKSVWFYYQIRSNITHRGKGVVRDHRILASALPQLLSIFRMVLAEAEAEAKKLADSLSQHKAPPPGV